MTGVEITCLQSFIDHGHDVRVYAYENCNAPAHFAIADAAAILPESDVFLYKDGPGKGSIAGFANLFRYALLSQTDQWWIDADIACLSPAWPTAKGPVAAAWEDERLVNCAVLSVDRVLAAELLGSAQARGTDLQWGQTGPGLLTQVVRDKGLEDFMLDRRAFYPIHYTEWTKPFRGEEAAAVQAATAESYAIHLWNEMLRRNAFEKSRLSPGSFFAGLVARHGTERYFTI